MDDQHDKPNDRDDEPGRSYFADFLTDILIGWFTLLVAKVRRIVLKARRKRE